MKYPIHAHARTANAIIVTGCSLSRLCLLRTLGLSPAYPLFITIVLSMSHKRNIRNTNILTYGGMLRIKAAMSPSIAAAIGHDVRDSDRDG